MNWDLVLYGIILIQPTAPMPSFIILFGALAISYQLGLELLNYGALLAFMGVNVASAMLGWRRGWQQEWFAMALSLIGFVICLFLWFNLSHPARYAGTAWALLGLALYLVYGRRAQVHAQL